ncbi:cation-translocating P-type ATPase [Bifidobacterium vespertilionis]|uniref:cation-translocating P-type ATPase n=1 Tax=Bifidobacterium vespertilionis TaxID=2562524 RepID=UPI001C3041BC|nr:cation-translocating P-type ATPase [Bifidobacterium vespertilionis]
MAESITGLTTREVEDRRARGEGETGAQGVTKSTGAILRENICTLFNALNFAIAILLFLVGAYSNMLFIAIIILNIVIGIVQELKAKKLVDELTILNQPHATVLRDGREIDVETREIVKDDVIVLESGRQICNDAVVLSGELEVNESLLTGESDSVDKKPGDQLLSGSSVISGRCHARVVHVGDANYANSLINEVRQSKRIHSELLDSMRKVTRFTSFLIIPLGVLLFAEAFFGRHAVTYDAVVSSAAALLGMLPKGLVLLISVSLATGVIRLAKRKILVQNIYSLETLAHVDVLCLDKTGTLTDGNMSVERVESLLGDGVADVPGAVMPGLSVATGLYVPSADRAALLMRSYLAASEDNNATISALRDYGGFAAGSSGVAAPGVLSADRVIPFSSKRKWGAITFAATAGLSSATPAGSVTVFLGAPERILGGTSARAAELMKQGLRLIAVGYYPGSWDDDMNLPQDLVPMYLIALRDTIRPRTRETLQYFREQGVDVKVISGDHPDTVSAVARQAGLERWADVIDMTTVPADAPDSAFEALVDRYAVFSRVTPKQKRQLVQALQRKGHQVAMTGDGVNDLLALREADCSIAIASGSDAARQIAQIVLLDSDFTYLPDVVLEGRKVVNNVTRTAAVFFIKTIYSTLVSFFCLALNIPFPFIPIQITLVDACIEAWPSFLTIFESDTRRIRGRFLPTALSKAAPFAVVVTAEIVVTSLMVPFAPAENTAVMYLMLIAVSMIAVIKSCIPFTWIRAFVSVTMAIGTPLALVILPRLFEVAAVTKPMTSYLVMAMICALIALAGYFALVRGLRGGDEEPGAQ